MLRHSLEHVLGSACGLVRGPITALAAASPRRKQGHDFWEAHIRPLRWTQGGSARRVRKDVMGP
jgi:hypothetical protein